MKDTAKQSALLREEMQFLLQIQTCEEVLFTIMNMIRQRGASIHLLTVEDIATFVHRMEMDFRTELFHVNFEQAIEASRLKMNQVQENFAANHRFFKKRC